MPVISVKDAPYFAKGDYDPGSNTGTDDTVAIQAAINAALSSANGTAGTTLVFPPGIYLTSSYLLFEGARGLGVMGSAFAAIRYQSDDTGLGPDGIAFTINSARSGFYLRYCSDVEISNLMFIGGNGTEISTVNVGSAIYLRNCVGTNIRKCVAQRGYAIVAQDAQPDTFGTGDSLAGSGLVTLTDAAGQFSFGHLGRTIRVSNTSHEVNSGTFIVTAVLSATQVQFVNSGSTSETSQFRWTVDDGDSGTRIEACRSESTRGTISIGSNAVIRDCEFNRPLNVDLIGFGDMLTVSSSVVTLTDAAGRFLPSHGGKLITIAGATNPANDGTFKLTYVSATEVSWANSSGASQVPFRQRWWIANGDKVGVGAGSSALSFSAGTVTLTSATAAFTAADVGNTIRIAGAPSTSNQGAFTITGYTSSTQVSWGNSSGVTESFIGVWSVDSFDRSVHNGNSYGSTHGIYVFGNGRSNILVEGCTFRGIRTTCVKASASNAPIRNVTVRGCYAYECGELFAGGADDSQEHTDLVVEGNSTRDCGFGSAGRGSGLVVEILGARGVIIRNNSFFWSHDAIATFDGRGFAGNKVISAGGTHGSTQPLEDLTIEGNKFAVDPISTTPGNQAPVTVSVSRVGIRNKWNTGGSVSLSVVSGSIMQLTDSLANFSYQDVDRVLRLSGFGSPNDGEFTITRVTGATTLEYAHAGSSGSSGSYGIRGGYTSDYSLGFGGGCRIAANDIHVPGAVGISLESNVAPEVVDNVLSNSYIYANGDVSPRIQRNRQICTGTGNAAIRIFAGTAWPIISENTITNVYIGSSDGGDMSVGDGSGAVLDWPLLGTRGRAVPTNAKQEVVVAYGSLLVDGDSLEIIGVVSAKFTYKAVSPGSNEFNSFTDLATKIGGVSGLSCTDYGAPFTVDTQHLKIVYSTPSSTDGAFSIANDAINPTALVVLSNTHSYRCTSRGAGSAGPVADKSVVWSQLCSLSGGVQLWAGNVVARATLVSNGWYSLKNSLDGGCCEIVNHGAPPAGGTEEYRWAVV